MLRFFAEKYLSYLADKMEQQEHRRMSVQKLPDGICSLKDISYLEDNKREHCLDVYFPENTEGRLPAIISIHGGGLFCGYKENNRNFNMHLAQYGYTVISLNYPLLPNVSFRKLLQDLMEAFRYLENCGREDEFHCDLEQVHIVGDSAGALLALYLCALEENKDMRKAFRIPRTNLKIRGLGLISGMFYPRYFLQLIFNKKGSLRKKAYYPYLNVEYLAEYCKLVPMYLVTSEEDILKEDTIRYTQILKKQKHPYALKVWSRVRGKELNHIFPVNEPDWPESRETMEGMLNYLKQQEI